MEVCKACGAELSEKEIEMDFRIADHRICAICMLVALINKDKIKQHIDRQKKNAQK